MFADGGRRAQPPTLADGEEFRYAVIDWIERIDNRRRRQRGRQCLPSPQSGDGRAGVCPGDPARGTTATRVLSAATDRLNPSTGETAVPLGRARLHRPHDVVDESTQERLAARDVGTRRVSKHTVG